MALSLESALLVKRRVMQSISGIGTAGKSPLAGAAFTEFWKWLAGHKNNPTLQFVAISDLTADVVAANVACKLFAVFLKKQATATDSFYNVFDDATNDATEGDKRLTLGLVTASEQQFWFNPNGLDLAAGMVHGAYTAAAGANGSTPTTSGDGPNGFVVIGAA